MRGAVITRELRWHTMSASQDHAGSGGPTAMHAGEVPTDITQVRRLLKVQFPQWAHRRIEALPPLGTDHWLYRLGDDLLVRLPRIDWAVDQVDRDRSWLPHVAPHVPVPVPAPVAVGAPGEGYPWPWTVVPWIPGANPDPEQPQEVRHRRLAADLGQFVRALHAVEPAGGPVKTGFTRGGPLAGPRDEQTMAAITELGGRIDTDRVTTVWQQLRDVPAWDRPGVWIHGDLQSGNLIVRGNRLAGVIDFGGLGLGDPAVDLMPAWNLFGAEARRTFREACGYDEDTWRRGMGWALSTGLIGLPYYWDTFPAFVAESRRKIDAVLAACP
jgi:aminoglycoside phosphotransferase (APT) family kinase protein